MRERAIMGAAGKSREAQVSPGRGRLQMWVTGGGRPGSRDAFRSGDCVTRVNYKKCHHDFFFLNRFHF